MQEDSIAASPAASQLSSHAVQTLSATQLWARIAGSGFLGLAVLKLIQGGITLARVYDQMSAGYIEHTRGIGMLFGDTLSTVAMIAVYCLTGTFALRYAIRLESVRPPRRPEPGEIALALGAQHRYWRLQGVLTLIGLGLVVLMIVLVVFVMALHIAH